jgi:uncharacterized Fe-S center protein
MSRARDLGNNWAADITGVTAGTGITGGGTSGTVTVTSDLSTSVASTSTTQAATPSAVKEAYDLALTKAPISLSTNAQTSSYELVLSDAYKIVEMNVATSNTLTVPTNASHAFPIGTQITVIQTGAGQTTIAGTSGVTVNTTPGLKLRTQWSAATLIKRDVDSWIAIGDLSS